MFCNKELCNIHMEESPMENYQFSIGETMQYTLSAVEMLRILGYTLPASGEWLEKLKQDHPINLPKIYTEFMELMADCPLLATSNLWVGKKERRGAPRIPLDILSLSMEVLQNSFQRDREIRHPSK